MPPAGEMPNGEAPMTNQVRMTNVSARSRTSGFGVGHWALGIRHCAQGAGWAARDGRVICIGKPGPRHGGRRSGCSSDPNGVVQTAQGEALGKWSPHIRGEPVGLVHVASHDNARRAERGHGMNGPFRTDLGGAIPSPGL